MNINIKTIFDMINLLLTVDRYTNRRNCYSSGTVQYLGLGQHRDGFLCHFNLPSIRGVAEPISKG